MNKITLKIEGMMCGMCEAHICDTIRKVLPDAKKVKASKSHGEATFLYEGEINEEAVKEAVTDTGYTCLSVASEPYKKRGIFGF